MSIEDSVLVKLQLLLQATGHGYSRRASADDEHRVVRVRIVGVGISDVDCTAGGHFAGKALPRPSHAGKKKMGFEREWGVLGDGAAGTESRGGGNVDI